MNISRKAKVIVGMSGGVDSSVAAWLLIEHGYQVEGLFMKNWEEDDTNEYCTATQDFADAQEICKQLQIPLHHVNFAREYWSNVFSFFLAESSAGRTPNPDILCNKEIKFNAFYKYARNLGADYIATGHYAQIDQEKNLLLQAKDPSKDQTYFLHAIDPTVLRHTIFPIGDYYKKEVRTFAKQLNFINFAKKDSTGLCFIGERNFRNFLQEFLLPKPGDIQSVNGEHLGNHMGLMFYTIGQRQGLGIGGQANKSEEPWYVVKKEIETNALIVAQGSNHPSLYAQGLICGPIHWLLNYSDRLPYACYAKIRYRQASQPCLISPLMNNQHTIMFSSLQRAVTPGQYIVFYAGKVCLGGAVIMTAIS